MKEIPTVCVYGFFDCRPQAFVRYARSSLRAFQKLSKEFHQQFDAVIRTYEKNPKTSSLLHITQGKITVKSVRTGPHVEPNKRDFQNLLKGMAKSPAKVKIFILSGHGSDWQEDLSGLGYGPIGSALKAVKGKKPFGTASVCLFDVCFGAIPNFLALFKPFFMVIAAQDTIRTAGFPTKKFLHTALTQNLDEVPKMARAFLLLSKGIKGIDTLIATDPREAAKLKNALERLNKALVSLTKKDPDAKKFIDKATRCGMKVLVDGPPDSIDVGKFLSALKKAPFHSKIFSEIKACEDRLNATILHKIINNGNKATGISYPAPFPKRLLETAS